LNRLVPIEVH